MPVSLSNGGETSTIAGVGKIAVLRANGLGDLIFVLPALEALRAAYPSAEIVLLARQMHRDLLTSRPSPVDSVVPVPRSRGVNGDERTIDDGPDLERFFVAMRAQRFDLALQLHGGGRYSNPFLLRLGARVTAGMRSDDAVPLDRSLPYIYLQHEVLRYLEVVSLVGATPVSIEPGLAITGEDVTVSEEALPETGRPLVVIHAGASDPRRRWPPRRFAALGDVLSAQGALVVMIGGSEETALAAEVLGHMSSDNAVDLSGRLSLSALVGLLARSALFLGNDSGPLHLAGAVGTASVGVYWCANMLNASPMTRLRHRALASWRVECPVCRVDCLKGTCEHRVSFVADVSLEDVRREALALFVEERGQTAQGASTRRRGMVVGSS